MAANVQQLGHIRCNRLTVGPEGGPGVEVMVTDSVIGLWVRWDPAHPNVGLVVDDNGNAFVTFNAPGQSQPPLAIGVGLNGEPFLQVASDHQLPRQVPLRNLLDRLEVEFEG